MAYKDRFGGTDICDGSVYNFSIGWDYNDNPSDEKQRYPVFLFIPDMEDPDHYHIELNRKQARILRDWLNDYLEGRATKWEKE